MTDQELLSTLENIKGLAVKAGKIQIENLGRSDLEIITKSSSIDLVTEVDKKSEKCILQFIGENYPSHNVLAEESGISSGQSDYLWVVDPLDGTTNYSQGLPIFSVSIALQYKKETVLGIVYAPVLRQMFTAVKGHGAYLNGSQIHVSAKKELSASVLATGFPYDRASHPVNNLNYFSALARKTRGVRRFGSAAYDLASVAVGHFDGYWEMNLSPWDVCAGILLVQEAGGEVIFFREDRKISLIAGNKNICRAIQTEIIHTDQTAAK